MNKHPFLHIRPIAMKDRISMVFLEYGLIDVKDGAFVLVDEKGIRTHIPVGSIACIMLEPGTRDISCCRQISSYSGDSFSLGWRSRSSFIFLRSTWGGPV